MRNWVERQRLLKDYERTRENHPPLKRSLEESCDRLDELWNLSRELRGAESLISESSYREHREAHAKVHDALRTLALARRRT